MKRTLVTSAIGFSFRVSKKIPWPFWTLAFLSCWELPREMCFPIFKSKILSSRIERALFLLNSSPPSLLLIPLHFYFLLSSPVQTHWWLLQLGWLCFRLYRCKVVVFQLFVNVRELCFGLVFLTESRLPLVFQTPLLSFCSLPFFFFPRLFSRPCPLISRVSL